MATKAELEAELAKLKLQLAELKATAKEEEIVEPEEPETGGWEDLSEISFEGIADQIIEELEGFPAKKPLLMALGVFVVGYMIGRSR